MQRHPCRPLVLATLLAMALPGCAGKRIRTAFQDELAAERLLTRHPFEPEIANAPPFHATLTLEPALLERLLMESIARSAENGRLQAVIQEEVDHALSERFDRIETRHPLAGRLFGRFVRERVRRVVEAPPVRIGTIEVRPGGRRCGFDQGQGETYGSATCLVADATLTIQPQGRPGPGEPAGHLAVLVAVEVAPAGTRIDVTAQALKIDELELDLSSQFPAGALDLEPVLERTKRRLDEALRSREATAEFSVRLDALDAFDADPRLEVEGVGVSVIPRSVPGGDTSGTASAGGDGREAAHTSPGERAALRVGFSLTVAADPMTDPAACPDPQGEDWTLSVGAPLLEHLALLGMKSGRVPTRFNGRGQPDDDGPYALHLESLSFTRGGFTFKLHLWHLGFPAWSRWYTVAGTVDVEDGRIVPRITAVAKGDGDGFLLFSRSVERRILNSRRLDSFVVLPAGHSSSEHARPWMDRLRPERIEMYPAALCIHGKVAPAATDSPPHVNRDGM